MRKHMRNYMYIIMFIIMHIMMRTHTHTCTCTGDQAAWRTAADELDPLAAVRHSPGLAQAGPAGSLR